MRAKVGIHGAGSVDSIGDAGLLIAVESDYSYALPVFPGGKYVL